MAPSRCRLVFSRGALLLGASGLCACMAPEDFLPLEDGSAEDTGAVDPWYLQDGDGDGLEDHEEEALGTDPEDADTDGDGWSDGDEVAAGTNPLWALHHPYTTGGYRVAACPEPPDDALAGPSGSTQVDIGGTTHAYAVYERGDLVFDAVFEDEWGQDLHLWSFCGQTVWVIVGDDGEAELQLAANELGQLFESLQDYTWTPIVVLRADKDGGVPGADRLAAWRSTFGLDGIPVVAPSNATQQLNLTAYDVDGESPSASVLGQDLRALSVDDDAGLTSSDPITDWLFD